MPATDCPTLSFSAACMKNCVHHSRQQEGAIISWTMLITHVNCLKLIRMELFTTVRCDLRHLRPISGLHPSIQTNTTGGTPNLHGYYQSHSRRREWNL